MVAKNQVSISSCGFAAPIIKVWSADFTFMPFAPKASASDPWFRQAAAPFAHTGRKAPAAIHSLRRLDVYKRQTFDTTYKSKVDKYLIPYFKTASLRNIKQIDIQGFFSCHYTLSRSTQNKLRIILYGIFDLAVDNDLCYKNPVKNIRISAVEPKKKRVYTMQESKQILDYCLTNNIIDILILLETGDRKSVV